MSAPLRESTRDAMIDQIVRTGINRTDASILTDVSKHAVDEAMAAAIRVVDPAPEHLRISALSSALASLAGIFRDRFPDHWTAFVATDAGNGEDGTVIVLPDRRAEG